MAKAFRTDATTQKKFQAEIQQRRNAPERVTCPLPDCQISYDMYGSPAANLVEHVAILQERVQREHPSHTSEVLSVNEFRRPRQKF